MHEYSIVQSLLDIIEEHAKKHNAMKVTKVVVKIGVLSGVEPDLLAIAFDTFKEASICKDARLDIKVQPIVLECRACGQRSELEKRAIFFECPWCKSADVDVVDGEEMLLMSLEME